MHSCTSWPRPPVIPDCVPRTALQWTFLGDRTLQLGESMQGLQSATLVLKHWFQPRSRGRASKWRHSGQAQSWTPCLSNQAVEDHRWCEWVPSTLGEVRLAPAHCRLAFSKDQSEVGHFLPWRALRGGSLSLPDRPCLSLVHFSKFLGLETFPSTSISGYYNESYKVELWFLFFVVSSLFFGVKLNQVVMGVRAQHRFWMLSLTSPCGSTALFP